MTEASTVLLAGSDRGPLTGVEALGPADPGQRLDVTVVLRRRAELPEEFGGGPLTADEFSYGADPEDIALLRRLAAEAGLDATNADPPSRRVTVSGPTDALCRFFGTELSRVRSGGVEFRHREGELSIPAAMDGRIVAVLGLDNRPQARTRHHIAGPGAARQSYTPPQLGAVYQFPPDTDGTGHSVAIVELGGGYGQSDLDSYFSGLGIPTPSVRAVGVDGAQNTPGQDPSGADAEVLLDIEVAGALAPKASFVVYFAPNSDQGFVDAVSTAVHASPAPTAVSISWGGPEDSWTEQARTALDQALADAAALGVTVCVASGDGGSSDGESDGSPHVDFPAASPHALACGGTTLAADAASGTVNSETGWPDSGGGVSTAFALPSWQQNAGVPARPGGGSGRGVPDVAGDADPSTGYQVLVDGQQQVIGGTSAVAPLWAALVTRLAQAAGTAPGLVQAALYAGAATGFRDITSGSNGAYGAAAGWDAVTGLGVPIGTALASVLQSVAAGSGQ